MANLTKEQRMAKEAEKEAQMKADLEAKLRAELEKKMKAELEEKLRTEMEEKFKVSEKDNIYIYACVHAKLLQSCLILGNHVDYRLPDSCPWDFPSNNTGVRSHSLLQGIFLTQGSSPCLLRLLIGRWILYH